MSYDVREQLQGIVDLNRGSFLYIGAMQPIERQFGDPCVGYVKDLQIEFDIDGKSGYVEVGECKNRLKRKIEIQTSPSVSPMILVNTANYGLTENTIKDRLKYLESNIGRIDLLIHRRTIGLPIKVAERLFIKNLPAFKYVIILIMTSTYVITELRLSLLLLAISLWFVCSPTCEVVSVVYAYSFVLHSLTFPIVFSLYPQGGKGGLKNCRTTFCRHPKQDSSHYWQARWL